MADVRELVTRSWYANIGLHSFCNGVTFADPAL